MENKMTDLRNKRIQTIKGSLRKIPIISKNTLKIESKIKNAQQQDKSSSATKNSQNGDDSTPLGLLDIKQLSLFEEKYEILQKIGQGANGFVNKCRKISTGEIYAVKSVMIDQEHILELKENFLAVRALNHPNIVQYKALYIDMRKKLCYIVMEYIDLPSLEKIQIESQEQLKNIIFQLLEALKYLHEKNISHRDLKPDNVLYDSTTKKIKIIDFGTSKKFFRRNTKVQMLTITGTLFYRAPQMFIGGGYDQKVDIWSIGILLYKLVAGRTPFQSPYLSDTINKIKQQDPTFDEPVWKKTENSLKNLIKRMLKKDKNERLSVAQCLRDVWFYSLTFAKLSEMTKSYRQYMYRVNNAEYGKRILKQHLSDPEKRYECLSFMVKKVDGQDYHTIDSQEEDPVCFKSAGDINDRRRMRRKLTSSMRS